MNWLRNRWDEPESRAAVAAALTALMAYANGTVNLQTTLLGLFGCVLTFVFPRPA